MSASDFLLDDMVYADVRNGWNHKIHSSTQKLSGLVPFVELFAVFKNDDVIFSDHGSGGPRFSDVAQRAIDVKFQYTAGHKVREDGSVYATQNDSSNEFAERFDISPESKIVPIASTAKSQSQVDSIGEASYRGHAGVNDIAVSRGASGPMNIKYEMNMTLPNPELINEMYEYSKLMILNSTFLINYGWHPHDFDYPNGPTPPPKITPGTRADQNIIELNSSNGGFYKSALVNLYKFNFSLDNVGHLGGKMTFLTLAGNFLVSTRAEAISTETKKMLNGYSGMLFSAQASDLAEEGELASESADRWIEQGTDYLAEAQVYANEWEKSIERRTRAWNSGKKVGDGPDDFRWGERKLAPASEEKSRKAQFTGESTIENVNVPIGFTTNKDALAYEFADWKKSDGTNMGEMRNKGIGPVSDITVKGWPLNDPAPSDGSGALADARPVFQLVNPQPVPDIYYNIPKDIRDEFLVEWNQLIDNDPRGEETNESLMELSRSGSEDILVTTEQLDSARALWLQGRSEAYIAMNPEKVGNTPLVYYNGFGSRPVRLMKTIPYASWLIERYTREKTEVLGFMDIDNGIPWAMPKQLEKSGVLEDYEGKLTTLDTMPAYGKDLMNNIWDEFAKVGNPNRTFFYPVPPDDSGGDYPVSIKDLGMRWVTSTSRPEMNYFLDPETVKVMKSSCAISTMLLEVAPEEEDPEEEGFWDDAGEVIGDALEFLSGAASAANPFSDGETLAEFYGEAKEDLLDPLDNELMQEIEDATGSGIDDTLSDALKQMSIYEVSTAGLDGEVGTDDDIETPLRFTTHSKPVYYFLGSVLEALRRSMGNVIKFVYSDIPLEGDINPGGFSIPVPKANKDAVETARKTIESIKEEMVEWQKKISKAQSMDPGDKEDAQPKTGDKTNRRKALEAELPKNATAEELDPITGKNKWGIRVPDATKKLTKANGNFIYVKETSKDAGDMEPDRRGEPMSTNEIRFEEQARRAMMTAEVERANIMMKRSESVLDPLQCKNVFELPIDISKARKILNEANAPLHNLINKLLKACDQTTKVIKLSTRPYASDETYLEIFVANIRVDGVVSEVFSGLDINSFLMGNDSDIRTNPGKYGLTDDQLKIARSTGGQDYSTSDIAAARTQALSGYFSEKAIVCEFGSERSLVESFSLSSKVDPNAFSTFRLPDIVGGQSIDIAAVVRGQLNNTSMGFINDMKGILEKGMYSGKQQLRDLQIISGSGDDLKVNKGNLESFLATNTAAATKIQTSFLTNLMAANQDFNTKVMSLQNEGITGSGGRQNTPSNNAFYGGVLSSYLRTISLTIHGTVGLGMFNVVYIKGLMRGIEGLYLITSVNEAITPGSFTTALECKLIQYKDTSQNNPLAANLNITLEEAANTSKSTFSEPGNYHLDKAQYEALFDQTEATLAANKNQGILMD